MNQGHSQVFHLEPQTMQNSAVQRQVMWLQLVCLSVTTSCGLREMVDVPFLELYHGIASIAPLPPLLLSLLNQSCNLWVFRTLDTLVQLATTHGTCLGLALWTDSIFPPLAAMEVLRPDPGPAPGIRTVDPVLRMILVVLLVELHFELVVEQLLHFLQRDRLAGAAAWRHVCGIVDGHSKDAAETRVAHTMSAFELGSFRRGDVVGAAGQAFDKTHSRNLSRGLTAEDGVEQRLALGASAKGGLLYCRLLGDDR